MNKSIIKTLKNVFNIKTILNKLYILFYINIHLNLKKNE